MFHINDPKVRELLLKGNFGLEKESLRITKEGYMAHTPHPFPDDDHIVRDFCENQTEINTPVLQSAEDAVNNLYEHTCRIHAKLAELEEPELLWPFSSPPYLRKETDIPVASFGGNLSGKTAYREYLSDRYGRYKMTFCGIHVNYSFADELLEADFALSEETDFTRYKNQVYVVLAERAAAYSWILTAFTAASPILDSSFVEKGCLGGDRFNGMASTRCSELGYWNYFTPIFDYSSVEAYADSMQRYVDLGFIVSPTELYYPVRLKPAGKNNLDTLKKNGVNHIELRMFDLNPLTEAGIEEKDVLFAQLLLVWLASTERQPFTQKDQVQAVANFRNAARYDLKTVKILVPNGEVYSVAHAAQNILNFMKEFYKGFDESVQEILAFEEEKIHYPEKRYAWQIREKYGREFVENGLILANKMQESMINV